MGGASASAVGRCRLRPLPNQEGAAARDPLTNFHTSYTALYDSHGQLWSLWPEAETLVYPAMAPPLLYFSASKSDPSSPARQVQKEGPKTIFEDREGNVWITTVLAVHRFRRVNITRAPVSTDQVFSAAFASDARGAMWMAADTSAFARFERDGVWKFDGRMEHVQREEIASATAICQGPDGSIWVGALATSRSSIYRRSPTALAFRPSQ